MIPFLSPYLKNRESFPFEKGFEEGFENGNSLPAARIGLLCAITPLNHLIAKLLAWE
jgi:hypothetical protein